MFSMVNNENPSASTKVGDAYALASLVGLAGYLFAAFAF